MYCTQFVIWQWQVVLYKHEWKVIRIKHGGVLNKNWVFCVQLKDTFSQDLQDVLWFFRFHFTTWPVQRRRLNVILYSICHSPEIQIEQSIIRRTFISKTSKACSSEVQRFLFFWDSKLKPDQWFYFKKESWILTKWSQSQRT